MAPSTEAVTNFGQTMRGRKFLVLIDGIPQSTPLRDASRGLNTIAPSSIERIEVVRGGTAAYGFGGTGGLINIITKEPSKKGFEAYSKVGTQFDTSDFDESVDYETEHRISGTQGSFDYLVSGSYRDRGGRFDGEGDRIPPDPLANQGGLADTEEFSILAKGGVDFDGGDQRLEVMVNHFENEQDSEFTFARSLEDDKTVAIPLDDVPPGRAPAENPGTENTAGRITYRNSDLLGSELRTTAYGLEQELVFGNDTFFVQSGNAQDKYGLRTTVDTPIGDVFFPGSSLTWGFDYLRDETDRVVFEDGATPSSPSLEADATAAFSQLEVPTGDKGLLRAGLRYETIDVDVASLARNGAFRPGTQNGFPIDEGSVELSEMLFNVGAVMYATDRLDVVVNFSQGFSLANFGRALRGATPQNGNSVDPENLSSEVQTVDQLEMGVRYYGDRLTASAFIFGSRSENGNTFTDDLTLRKRDEEIWGIEGEADYRINEQHELGGSFSWSEGLRVASEGSTKKVRLPGSRISPLKVTGYWESAPMPWWDNRLQFTYVGNRNQFKDAAGPDTNFGFDEGEVDDYIVFDLNSRFDVGPGKLGVSIRNLLDNEYKPAINQAFNIPSSFANATGRRFGLSYSLEW